MLRSMAHYKRRRPPQTDILPPIFFEGQGEYLIRLYIGSPPVQTWAIPDTGSDLIWIQCLPCNTCFPQNAPIFNPFASSTYNIVSCHSKPCRSFFIGARSGCGSSTQCVYGYAYGDGSTTFGELARDLFSFGGRSDDSFKKPLLLGCGHKNSGIFSRKGSGLVGLGGGPLSLVSQLGPVIDHTFSYCLVPFFSKSRGKLKLGKDSKISGSSGTVSTPFVTKDSFKTNYYLTLEGITVGDKTLKTSPTKRKGNTLIDSGATYFLLESSFYTKMESLTKKAISVKVRKPPEPFILCYSNKYSETIKKRFPPKFVVHFEGADIALKPYQNIFFQVDNLLCLAILPNDGFDYGSLPQVNFQVEYDLKAKKISFAHADCGKN